MLKSEHHDGHQIDSDHQSNNARYESLNGLNDNLHSVDLIHADVQRIGQPMGYRPKPVT